jgi:broad specificity phosphatase PhoE
MEAPAITHQRRPFLAPLWLTLLALLVMGAAGWLIYRSATTTVIMLVQPVEKQPGTIADPPLSQEGEERAQRLEQMFGPISGRGHLDAIYVSDDLRAQQTAAPLVERLRRGPTVFKAAEARAAAARLLHEYPGGTVLVIASAPALGQVVQELGGADAVPPAEDDADLAYIVSVPSVGHTHLMRFRF